jgi:hypothetical protein
MGESSGEWRIISYGPRNTRAIASYIYEHRPETLISLIHEYKVSRNIEMLQWVNPAHITEKYLCNTPLSSINANTDSRSLPGHLRNRVRLRSYLFRIVIKFLVAKCSTFANIPFIGASR